MPRAEAEGPAGKRSRQRAKPRGSRGKGRGKGGKKEDEDGGKPLSPILSEGSSTNSPSLRAKLAIDIPADEDAARSGAILSARRMHPYSRLSSAHKSPRSLASNGTPKSLGSTATPTSQMVMQMAAHCLESPAFSTRSRTGAASLGDVPEEVNHATLWWVKSLRSARTVAPSSIETFKEKLFKDLEFRCCYHWYPASPQKGSGYRSIVNGVKVDDALLRACEASNIDVGLLPRPTIMFVNPGEVKVQHVDTQQCESVYRQEAAAAKSSAEQRRAANPFAQAIARQLAQV